MGIIERKEREKEARRSQILDAAELIFQAKGLGQATMDDIAKAAELAKGTIYLYYRNKDELTLGIMLRAQETMLGKFQEAVSNASLSLQRLSALGTAYFDYVTTHGFHFSLMCMSENLPQRQQINDELLLQFYENTNGIWQLLVGLIEEGKREGTVRPEVESFSAACSLWMSCLGVLRVYHSASQSGNCFSQKPELNFSKMDFRRMYNLAASLVLSQIVTPEGAKYIEPVQFPSMQELGVDPGHVLDGMQIACEPMTNEILKSATI
jgi:TetR/AcrR family transcriptional regulator